MPEASQQTKAPQRLSFGRDPVVPTGLVSARHKMREPGKYRWRTRLRSRLPYALLWLAPKGLKDCGEHEWYREDATTALCYHCEAGERSLGPGERVGPSAAPTSEPRVPVAH